MFPLIRLGTRPCRPPPIACPPGNISSAGRVSERRSAFLALLSASFLVLWPLAGCRDTAGDRPSISPVSPTSLPNLEPTSNTYFAWSVKVESLRSSPQSDNAGGCLRHFVEESWWILNCVDLVRDGETGRIRLPPDILERNGGSSPGFWVIVELSIREVGTNVVVADPVVEVRFDIEMPAFTVNEATGVCDQEVVPRVRKIDDTIVTNVDVRGYGAVRITATHAGRIGHLVIDFPGKNKPDVSTKYFVLSDPPRIPRGGIQCTTQRQDALQYGPVNYLWEDWPLPIPIDVVDNFPDASPADSTAILRQIDRLAEQIDDALGFSVIESGSLIAHADRGRPERERRFHIKYDPGRCNRGDSYVASACAGGGIATWTEGDTHDDQYFPGEVVALPHEIEHLLGFKHPAVWEDGDSRSSHGVPMSTGPDYHHYEPGQSCFGNPLHNGPYSEWEQNHHMAPETLANLYCIFNRHPGR